MAITDHGNMSGTFGFFMKCKAAGIKPILGMEAYLNDSISEKNEEKGYEGKDTHQSILIMNKEGYVNLNKLTTSRCLIKYNKKNVVKLPGDLHRVFNRRMPTQMFEKYYFTGFLCGFP
jgi:DNA polymerase III alpha subunit